MHPALVVLLITGTAYVVYRILSDSSGNTQDRKTEATPPSRVADVTPTEKVVQRPRPLSLGLVLKGKNLGNISHQTILPLKEVQEALAESDYFFCTTLENMDRVKNELNLNNEEPDRNSEQQVLVIIDFESELQEGKKFINKMELTPFLQKMGLQFTVSSVNTLNKVSGLIKSGFIRS